MWETVRWLHLVAMALFVGGQLALVAVIVPVLRGGDGETLRAMARRFAAASAVALVVLAVTGMAMAGHFHDWERTELQVKLGLVGLVIALIVLHTRRPAWHALEGAVFLASLAIVWLGVDLAH
jgi:putative copper export protein